MRGLQFHIGSPSMAIVLDRPSRWSQFKGAVGRVHRHVRQISCAAIHGGHELYRARSDTKLFQQCLLCGYETPGWTIDRRDRRLHLVANKEERRDCQSRV